MPERDSARGALYKAPDPAPQPASSPHRQPDPPPRPTRETITLARSAAVAGAAGAPPDLVAAAASNRVPPVFLKTGRFFFTVFFRFFRFVLF